MLDLDAQKLGRILEMLASSHDGEVVSAARHATRIVRDAGLTWTEVAKRVETKAATTQETPGYRAAPEARTYKPRSYARKKETPEAPKKRMATHKGVKASELVAYLLHPSSQARMSAFEKAVVATLHGSPHLHPSEAQWRIIWETGQKIGVIMESFAA